MPKHGKPFFWKFFPLFLAIFRFLQTCSTWFRPTLWILSSSEPTPVFSCWYTLCCWNVNHLCSLRTWTHWKKFSLRIAEKHLKILTLTFWFSNSQEAVKCLLVRNGFWLATLPQRPDWGSAAWWLLFCKALHEGTQDLIYCDPWVLGCLSDQGPSSLIT